MSDQEPVHTEGNSSVHGPLPPDLQAYILSLLPPNEIALNARLVSVDAARRFAKLNQRLVLLSNALPPQASAWALAQAQAGFKHLTFQNKLQLPSTAAASGSEANMDLAWALLRPSLIPELLQTEHYASLLDHPDPGVSASRTGNSHLLPWLSRHCPFLLHPKDVLWETALCGLPALQASWKVLCLLDPTLTLRSCLKAAAESETPDARAKVQWILEEDGADASLPSDWLASAAASSGDLPALQALHGEGCSMRSSCAQLLTSALCGGHLAVADWLLDVAGCELPGRLHEPGDDDNVNNGVIGIGNDHNNDNDNNHADEGDGDEEGGANDGVSEDGSSASGEEAEAAEEWKDLLLAVAASGRESPLRWLHARGAPLDTVPGSTGVGGSGPSSKRGSQLLSEAAGAADGGSLGAVRFLHEECGHAFGKRVSAAAAAAGNLEALAWLRERGCCMGAGTYLAAAREGRVEVVRWLVKDAGVPWRWSSKAACRLFEQWPRRTPAEAAGLLEAVKLLAEGAGRCSGKRLGGAAEDLVDYAAQRGDLPLVRYMVEECGWEVDGETFEWAAEGGCEALLEWLAARGCAKVASAGMCFAGAGVHGDVRCMQELVLLGVGWSDEVLAMAVRRGSPLPVLKWMVGKGAPAGVVALAQALTDVQENWEAVGEGGEEVRVGDDVAMWLIALAQPLVRGGEQRWWGQVLPVAAAAALMAGVLTFWAVRLSQRARQNG